MLKDYIIEDLGFDKPIYPSLGNHEAFPCDLLDPTINKWIFEVVAEIFKDYMTDEAYETFRNYGYYQMLHPNTNMRIIATISSPMDAMNWWHVPNNTDPLG